METEQLHPLDEGLHLDTLAVHAGRPARVPDAPLSTPIVAASTYVSGGPMLYGRYGNPGWTSLEAAVGALEGGWACAFSSGMGAIGAVWSLVPGGGRVVVADGCYLAVAALAGDLAEQRGVQVTTVDVSDTDAVVAVGRDADLIWLESPTNPLMVVGDLPAIAAGLAGRRGLLAIDSTFMTPVLARPLGFGADLVMHSATKYLSGHSDALLGVVCGRPDRPEVREALATYRGRYGVFPGTLEAYLVLRGLRTLRLRVEHSQAGARFLAARLSGHPAVTRVRYPGWGSMISIELVDVAAADRLCGSTRIWVNATSLGGVESLLERRRALPGESPGVPPTLVRLSVGIEDPTDLWEDLARGL